MYGKKSERARRRFCASVGLLRAPAFEGEVEKAGDEGREDVWYASAAAPGPGDSKEDAAFEIGRSSISSESISMVGISA